MSYTVEHVVADTKAMMEDFYQEFRQREHWADWAMDLHVEFFMELAEKTMAAITDADREMRHAHKNGMDWGVGGENVSVLYFEEEKACRDRRAVLANDLVRIHRFLGRHNMLR